MKKASHSARDLNQTSLQQSPPILHLPDNILARAFSKNVLRGRTVCKNLYKCLRHCGSSDVPLYLRLKNGRIANAEDGSRPRLELRALSPERVAVDLAFLQSFSSLILLVPCISENIIWKQVLWAVKQILALKTVDELTVAVVATWNTIESEELQARVASVLSQPHPLPSEQVLLTLAALMRGRQTLEVESHFLAARMLTIDGASPELREAALELLQPQVCRCFVLFFCA